jgi:hypothetical protein
MLKRTLTLVSLTITLGTLLLALGCSGSNTNPVAPVSSDQPLVSRQENQPPSAPQLGFITTLWGDNYVLARSIDPEGNPVQYRLTLSNGQVFDQTQGAQNWVINLLNPTPVSSYSSGQWAWCKLPKLPIGSYTATVQAIDPNPTGSGKWGGESSLNFSIRK